MARRACLAAIFTIGGLGLLGTSLSNATVPEESELTNGTISQGGVTVPLGSSTICGLRGKVQPSACATPLSRGGFGDHQIPLLTPGIIRIHLIAPVKFLEAGSYTPKVTKGPSKREIKGDCQTSRCYRRHCNFSAATPPRGRGVGKRELPGHEGNALFNPNRRADHLKSVM
jgi:hypothetical protein